MCWPQVGFFPDLRICSYTFNVNVFLFIWNETNAQEKELWLVLLVSIHAYWNEMWIWQDSGPEEQKEGWMHSGRVPILYGMQRCTGCVGKKQRAEHLPLFKSLRKGSSPLPDKLENPHSCGRAGREGGRAWGQVFLFLSFTLSLSQACVCAGRVTWALSVLTFGRVKEK